MLQPHATGQIKSVPHGGDIGLTLSHDIESRAVGRCRNGEGHPSKNRDAVVESSQFHRYLTLVMIHGYDSVVIAGQSL